MALAAPAAASDRFRGLPVYPGAASQAPVTISKTCGGTYHVRTSAFIWSAAASDLPARIAAWYQQALPGARLAHFDVTGGGTTVHALEVSSADGSAVVTTSVAGQKTVIGLTSVNPPVQLAKYEKMQCTDVH